MIGVFQLRLDGKLNGRREPGAGIAYKFSHTSKPPAIILTDNKNRYTCDYERAARAEAQPPLSVVTSAIIGVTKHKVRSG